jgi:hypothetical protein
VGGGTTGAGCRVTSRNWAAPPGNSVPCARSAAINSAAISHGGPRDIHQELAASAARDGPRRYSSTDAGTDDSRGEAVGPHHRPVGCRRKHVPAAVIVPKEEQCAQAARLCGLDAYIAPPARTGATELGHMGPALGESVQAIFQLGNAGTTTHVSSLVRRCCRRRATTSGRVGHRAAKARSTLTQPLRIPAGDSPHCFQQSLRARSRARRSRKKLASAIPVSLAAVLMSVSTAPSRYRIWSRLATRRRPPRKNIRDARGSRVSPPHSAVCELIASLARACHSRFCS